MKIENKKIKLVSFETKTLLCVTGILITVVMIAWSYALKLNHKIAASQSGAQLDVSAIVEIEHIRNIAESQISNSRSFFLLGSSTLFEEQKKERQSFLTSIESFERLYKLPQIPEIIKGITALEHQQQEIFDQAMKFREKRTEPKIVGQFYQSKVMPIRANLNHMLDEIIQIHKAELDRIRSQSKAAAVGAESQLPIGMLWFTGAVSVLFLILFFLVMRMVNERTRQEIERHRLFTEAQKMLQARDEIVVAISKDLEDPLNAIVDIADQLNLPEYSELIKSSVIQTKGVVKNIIDQAKSDQKSLTLRLDQLGIDVILDDARLMLQPLAKQRDIRLQFESINPPTLAFFDRERVLRILSNLVGNAIKFSPKHSKVVVKVRSDQQFVFISVVDSGPGISENQIPELFDHFWQARDTADQGAGLGLAVVKTIVEAHGGSVRVESKLGFGSTFTFSLPRRRPVGAQMTRPAPTVRQAQRAHASPELNS